MMIYPPRGSSSEAPVGRRRAYHVSRDSPVPLYHQIESDMQERIRSGEWVAGQRIPTESELCSLYGASRITVRQAVSKLVAKGLVDRQPGRGTFVRQPLITAGERGLTSFTDEMTGLGLRAGGRVLRVAVEPSPEKVAGKLRLTPGEPVLAVARLRLGNDQPLGLQTAYLPSVWFPGLEDTDLEDRSLYAYLEEAYGVVPREAEETFFVEPIRGEDARLLGVKSGACGFRVERLTFEAKGPFEFVTSLMRGDRYRVHLGLRALT